MHRSKGPLSLQRPLIYDRSIAFKASLSVLKRHKLKDAFIYDRDAEGTLGPQNARGTKGDDIRKNRDGTVARQKRYLHSTVEIMIFPVTVIVPNRTPALVFGLKSMIIFK